MSRVGVLIAAALVLSPTALGQTAASAAPSMRAIVYHEYGGPEVVRLEPVEKPAPADDELLVRVHAAGINPLEVHYVTGVPYVVRLQSGLRRPADPRLGVDFAGTVEAVGRNVTRFRPGDAVFGGRSGALAEYVTVRESRTVARMPANVTFEQAAGVAVAGLTALQALRDKGQLRPGQRVLINGASGGVGTFAVQIAKALGAHVTGVCSTRNLALVRALGADEVIDYTKEDFMERDERYDLVVDNVGNHPMLAFRRVLTPQGVHVTVGGPKTGRWIGPMNRFAAAPVASALASQRFETLLSTLNGEDLQFLASLMAAGKVRTVIDRRYRLGEVPEALRYVATGRARGKVVIAVP